MFRTGTFAVAALVAAISTGAHAQTTIGTGPGPIQGRHVGDLSPMGAGSPASRWLATTMSPPKASDPLGVEHADQRGYPCETAAALAGMTKAKLPLASDPL